MKAEQNQWLRNSPSQKSDKLKSDKVAKTKQKQCVRQKENLIKDQVRGGKNPARARARVGFSKAAAAFSMGGVVFGNFQIGKNFKAGRGSGGGWYG